LAARETPMDLQTTARTQCLLLRPCPAQSGQTAAQSPSAIESAALQNPVLQRGCNPQPPAAQSSSASESASQRIAPWREPGEQSRNFEEQQPRASETMEHPPRSADATPSPAPSGAHPVAQQPTPSPQGTHPVAQQPTPRRQRGASTDNTDNLRTPATSAQITETKMVMPKSTSPMSVSAFYNTDTDTGANLSCATPSRASSEAPAAQQPTAQSSSASERASQRIAPRRESGEKRRKPGEQSRNFGEQQPRASETMEHPPRSADATSNLVPNPSCASSEVPSREATEPLDPSCASSEAPAAQQPTAQSSSASERASQRIAPRRESGEKRRKPGEQSRNFGEQQPRASETMEHPPRSADATSNLVPTPSCASSEVPSREATEPLDPSCASSEAPAAQQPTPSGKAAKPRPQSGPGTDTDTRTNFGLGPMDRNCQSSLRATAGRGHGYLQQ
jgi:hypothetical protein